MCNSYKSDKMAVVDPQSSLEARFFNPRTDDWSGHFEWTENGAVVQGKTSIGRATVEALNMNHPDIVAIRKL